MGQQYIHGCVGMTPDGDPITISGTGFNVTKIDTGVYLITFDKSFRDPPAVVTTSQANDEWDNFEDIYYKSTHSGLAAVWPYQCQIETMEGFWSPPSPPYWTPADRCFSFVAVGQEE